jgi:FlaA1/EpsC-like NDP-sugar epimerase
MTRQQSFFGRLVAATDLAILFASFLLAYWCRLKLWLLAYPVLPIGTPRTNAWVITVMFPAWLFACRYFSLYNPTTYRSSLRVIRAAFKAQILASVLMLNAVFIIRGFAGISRPLLALIIMFSFVGLMTEKLAILFLMRYRWRLQRRSALWRVLLVGSRSDAENYLELVREHPEWNLEIVDVIPASSDGTAMR